MQYERLQIAKGTVLGHEGKTFDAYFWFVGWDCLSLGVSVCVSLPNIEFHVPFGFVRVGWKKWH